MRYLIVLNPDLCLLPYFYEYFQIIIPKEIIYYKVNHLRPLNNEFLAMDLLQAIRNNLFDWIKRLWKPWKFTNVYHHRVSDGDIRL